MKGNKLFGAGFLLVVALLLVAIPASASAKTLLQFDEEGVAAASGATAYTVLNIDEPAGCAAKAEGKVVTNPSKKVVVTATTLGAEGYERCSARSGASESGHIEETAWESSGTLKVKASIQLTFPTGPCAYVFSKFKPEKSTYPGQTGTRGEVTGKLNKKVSSKTKGACAKTMTTGYGISVLDEEEETFETELT